MCMRAYLCPHRLAGLCYVGIAHAQLSPAGQAGLRTHTFPRTLFHLANHTSEGLDCIPDKPPVERPISFGSASSTLGDAEEVRIFGSSPLPKHARNRSCLAAL